MPLSAPAPCRVARRRRAISLPLLLALSTAPSLPAAAALEPVMEPDLARAVAFAESQMRAMLEDLGYAAPDVHPDWSASPAPAVFPKVSDATNAELTWEFTPAGNNWGAGFTPGIFWILYDLTGDDYWRAKASAWTDAILPLKNSGRDMQMNLGFHMMPTVARRHAEFPNPTDADTLAAAAARLAEAWMPAVGSLYSFTWNGRVKFDGLNGGWSAYANTIIDSAPNLEILFYQAKHASDPTLWDIALSHLANLLRDNVRADGSTAQLASYDTATGALLGLRGHQGYSGASTWSRGQGWALHGIATAWRETADPALGTVFHDLFAYYRDHAPPDGVPYWDFDAPLLSDAELEFRYPGADAPAIRFARDTSAAALAAAALLQAAQLETSASLRADYLDYANHILRSLAQPGYLAVDAEGNPTRSSILRQGAYTFPGVDKGQIWGDFFFVQALLRLQHTLAPIDAFADDSVLGNRAAYTIDHPQLWTVEWDEGDRALRAQGFVQGGDDEAPTSIALHATPVDGPFIAQFAFRADALLADAAPADAAFVFGAADPRNYWLARLSTIPGHSGFYRVIDGAPPVALATCDAPAAWSGHGYHHARVVRDASRLHLWCDGTRIVSIDAPAELPQAGAIGFASLANAVFYDEPGINTAPAPLALWQATAFADPDATEAAPSADADADGFANLLEYALGSDPRDARAPASHGFITFVPAADGHGPRLRHALNPHATDIELRLMRSTDGAETWQTIATVRPTDGASHLEHPLAAADEAASLPSALYRIEVAPLNH